MTGLGVAEAEVALDAAADAEAVSLGAAEVWLPPRYLPDGRMPQAGHQDPEGYRRSALRGG